jgi:hypothetical protein
MGANRYDPTDSQWAFANDWWPEGRYAPLDSLSTLWHEVENEEVPAWLVVQAVVLSIVKAFFARQASDFRSASGLRSVTVTSGFDDGDLFTVVTPLTPAA